MLTAPDREELPFLPASDYFGRIASLDWPVWLDSGAPHRTGGRFDILAAEPREKIQLDAQDCGLDLLRQKLAQLEPLQVQEDVPFCSGLLGYFKYESNHRLLGLVPPASQPLAGEFGLYDWALVIDNQAQRSTLLFHPSCPESRRQKIGACLARAPQAHGGSFSLCEPFVASESAEHYCDKVNRVIEYLLAGDCYQVNLSQHFSAAYQGDLLDAYLNLRSSTPVPHGAFIRFADATLLSLSPERFLSLHGNQVETWPIKGTAARDAARDADRHAAEALYKSPKNRAENLMIVDLMRNDLSRVCVAGSIAVPEMFELQSFSNVHHLVSRVSGLLDPHKDVFSLLESCLPGGSITGAPKRRAMEIIEELETEPRSAYCGSIAYISCCGNMDSSISIRTFEARDNRLNIRGGGGIVADSVAAEEYRETLDKIQPHMRQLESRMPNF